MIKTPDELASALRYIFLLHLDLNAEAEPAINKPLTYDSLNIALLVFYRHRYQDQVAENSCLDAQTATFCHSKYLEVCRHMANFKRDKPVDWVERTYIMLDVCLNELAEDLYRHFSVMDTLSKPALSPTA